MEPQGPALIMRKIIKTGIGNMPFSLLLLFGKAITFWQWNQVENCQFVEKKEIP